MNENSFFYKVLITLLGTVILTFIISVIAYIVLLLLHLGFGIKEPTIMSAIAIGFLVDILLELISMVKRI